MQLVFLAYHYVGASSVSCHTAPFCTVTESNAAPKNAPRCWL